MGVVPSSNHPAEARQHPALRAEILSMLKTRLNFFPIISGLRRKISITNKSKNDINKYNESDQIPSSWPVKNSRRASTGPANLYSFLREPTGPRRPEGVLF